MECFCHGQMPKLLWQRVQLLGGTMALIQDSVCTQVFALIMQNYVLNKAHKARFVLMAVKNPQFQVVRPAWSRFKRPASMRRLDQKRRYLWVDKSSKSSETARSKHKIRIDSSSWMHQREESWQAIVAFLDHYRLGSILGEGTWRKHFPSIHVIHTARRFQNTLSVFPYHPVRQKELALN